MTHAELEESLKAHIPFHTNEENRIGYIYIGDRSNSINQGTWLYVKQALDHYKETKPLFIIMELNTPGGEVFAAEKISDALKEMDTQYNIPIVAYINNWAMSAGALLAYSCRYIAVVKDASMGAAEPIQLSAEGKMETASEKVNSALRADFANRANFFGRNPYIAEAMVDKDVILVLREGKVIKLDYENQIKQEGPDKDLIVSPKGKLLTLDAEQLMKYEVADIFLEPLKLEPLTAEEKERGVWPASKSLLFTYPYFKEIPRAKIDKLSSGLENALFHAPCKSHGLIPSIFWASFRTLSRNKYTWCHTSWNGCGALSFFDPFVELCSRGDQLVGNHFAHHRRTHLISGTFCPTDIWLLGFIGILFCLVGLFGLMIPGFRICLF